MSANNWAICPRCLHKAQGNHLAAVEDVMASYGSIPLEEFDAARAALKEIDPEDFRTFREDYEFYGAEEGEITASYKGTCTECGLGCDLSTTKRFWSEKTEQSAGESSK